MELTERSCKPCCLGVMSAWLEGTSAEMLAAGCRGRKESHVASSRVAGPRGPRRSGKGRAGSKINCIDRKGGQPPHLHPRGLGTAHALETLAQ